VSRVVLLHLACERSVEWAVVVVKPPTVVRLNCNAQLHKLLLCLQVTITTRQLVSHLAGIRHYDKSSDSCKNKETTSKAVKDKKSVSFLLVVVGVFCFLLLCLRVGHCVSCLHIQRLRWSSG
jgi:hypothetical protein